MFRLIRTGISVVVLGVALWAAFVIDLGGKTFAEHVDTISATPEAEQLVEGTRAKINPALQELRDRVLGEYVEAPTWIPAAPPQSQAQAQAQVQAKSQREPGTAAGEKAREQVPASTLNPGTSFEPALPGRRAGPTNEADHEPALPGRR